MILNNRFWDKVERTNTCWNWIGSLTDRGYGEFVVNKKKRKAHILSWMDFHQADTNGLCVCHTCDNPKCVNPEHLYLGTPQDNMNDKVARNRQSKMPGESHPMAKLSREDIINIRNDRRSSRDIGKEYGISHSHVLRIKKGEKWNSVEK